MQTIRQLPDSEVSRQQRHFPSGTCVLLPVCASEYNNMFDLRALYLTLHCLQKCDLTNHESNLVCCAEAACPSLPQGIVAQLPIGSKAADCEFYKT